MYEHCFIVEFKCQKNPFISPNNLKINLKMWKDLHKFPNDVLPTLAYTKRIRLVPTSLSSNNYRSKSLICNFHLKVSVTLCTGYDKFITSHMNVNSFISALQCRHSGCTIIAFLVAFLRCSMLFWYLWPSYTHCFIRCLHKIGLKGFDTNPQNWGIHRLKAYIHY